MMNDAERIKKELEKIGGEFVAGEHPGKLFFDRYIADKNSEDKDEICSEMDIGWNYLKKIACGEKRVTPKIAIKMSAYSGVSSKIWLEMQYKFDLELLK